MRRCEVRRLGHIATQQRITLHAYVDANLNVAAAAKELILHPNSVRYRLRRIASLTGRDPRQVTDLFELRAAARLLDAQAGHASFGISPPRPHDHERTPRPSATPPATGRAT